jgi:hypothetical protein
MLGRNPLFARAPWRNLEATDRRGAPSLTLFEVALFVKKQAFSPCGHVAAVSAVASEFLARSVSEGGLR